MFEKNREEQAFPTPTRAAALVFWLIFLVAIDQLSKIWALTHRVGKPPSTYLGIFQLTYAENHGGWGSLGAQWNDFARTLALQAIPGVLLLGMAIYAFRYAMPAAKSFGMIVLVAGGMGNLIDRVRFGHVVDFLYIGYGPVGTNIFNIADMAILAGVGLMLYGSWQEDKAEKEAAQSEDG